MSSARVETKLWLWQRMSAAVLGLCVVVHLVTMVYAVQNGLDAAEIIARVSGNVAWLIFYSVFVIAVAVHAPIGIRTILNEVTSLGKKQVHMIMAALSLIMLVMGFRAVIGLFLVGA